MLYLAVERLHICSLFNITHKVWGTSKSIKKPCQKRKKKIKIAIID